MAAAVGWHIGTLWYRWLHKPYGRNIKLERNIEILDSGMLFFHKKNNLAPAFLIHRNGDMPASYSLYHTSYFKNNKHHRIGKPAQIYGIQNHIILEYFEYDVRLPEPISNS